MNKKNTEHIRVRRDNINSNQMTTLERTQLGEKKNTNKNREKKQSGGMEASTRRKGVKSTLGRGGNKLGSLLRDHWGEWRDGQSIYH